MTNNFSVTTMTYLISPPLGHNELVNGALFPPPVNALLNQLFVYFGWTNTQLQQMIQEEDSRLDESIRQGHKFKETPLEQRSSRNLFWICQFPADLDGARLLVLEDTKAKWIIEQSGPLLSGKGEYLHSILQKRTYLTMPGNMKQILEEDGIRSAIENIEHLPSLAENRPPVDHPLKFLIWNCSGAESPGFRWNFKRLITCCCPDVVAITETAISGDRARAICASLNFDRCFVADTGAFGGGLWLLWDSTTVRQCEILALSQQEIHATIQSVH